MSNSAPTPPNAGLIGGTGFAEALDAIYGPATEEIPVETPYGTPTVSIFSAGPLESGQIYKVAFLKRHGDGHSVPPHRINHRANIWALHSLGVRSLFATAAAGSLKREWAPGALFVLDDFLDFRGGEPTTFFDSVGDVRHTDFSAPFSRRMRSYLIEEAERLRREWDAPPTVHPRGTYLCLSGPRYETPAEVRLFAAWGADLVGMTAAAEAILAREIEMEYACVAIATNYGSGLSEAPLSHEEVGAQMARSRPFLIALFDRAFRRCAQDSIPPF